MSTSTPSVSFPATSVGGGDGDGSWMAQLAKALAKTMTNMQNRMIADGNKMADASASPDNKGLQAESNKANTDLQVVTQEYSLLVNAINTVMKTVGDANTALARKQ